MANDEDVDDLELIEDGQDSHDDCRAANATESPGVGSILFRAVLALAVVVAFILDPQSSVPPP